MMMMLALVFTGLPVFAQAEKFAVLAAGSSGWMNYRHQADACHAYQVMKKSGIREENIILMMFDDVASASDNPFPGKLFNKPGNDSVDVYDGCKIAYRGETVTAELFSNVITGNENGVPANGKVLKSGADDEVFIFFVDHGAPGFVAFPTGPPLHVENLTANIVAMQSKNMFKQMVIYMEACFSGSMFPSLAPDSKVLAVTAANAHESSYGTYCGFDVASEVHGKQLNTCLGDLFSVSWMEDSDGGAFSDETIATQIQRVRKRTNKSHVLTFGDTSFESEPIGDIIKSLGARELPRVEDDENSIDARDIDVHMAYQAWARAKTHEKKAAAWEWFMTIAAARAEDKTIFEEIIKQACADVNLYQCEQTFLNQEADLRDMVCHGDLVRTIYDECPRQAPVYNSPGGWNGHNMKFSQVLVNLCQGQEILGKKTDALKQIVHKACYNSRLRVQGQEQVIV